MKFCDHCPNWAQWLLENKETRKKHFVCGQHKEELLTILDPKILNVHFCGVVPLHANA